jgi:hypothetical protein
LHEAHDRSFVVAGATKDAMLSDFQQAIDDAITKGMPFKGWKDKQGNYQKGFLDQFDEIVARHGWDYNGGRDWRARIIYDTNMKSAYAAGRFKQMNDPATLKAFPYWKYVHGLERVPTQPREEHLHWDGLILRADDDWWLTYYPPNGWKCGCGVIPVSAAELKQMGKTYPDRSPKIKYEKRRDPGTDEWMDYPTGVDMGWACAPGRTWSEGLVPKALSQTLKPIDLVDVPRNLTPLRDLTAPSKATMLEMDKPEGFYLDAFLSRFGASAGLAKLHRDKSGHVMPISDDLFRTATGDIKIKKFGREASVEFLADTVLDPDEIWVDWAKNKSGKIYLVKRFVRYFENVSGYASFSWTSAGWFGKTAFNPSKKNKLDRPNRDYLERLRKGALLYRRKKENE